MSAAKSQGPHLRPCGDKFVPRAVAPASDWRRRRDARFYDGGLNRKLRRSRRSTG